MTLTVTIASLRRVGTRDTVADHVPRGAVSATKATGMVKVFASIRVMTCGPL